MTRREVTAQHVIDALLDNDGNVSKAARSLDVARETVRGRLRSIAGLKPHASIADAALVRIALDTWERARVDEQAPVAPRPARSDWRSAAACLDVDPELFFPIGNAGPALRQIAQAKAICHRCPVAETCLTWAMDTNQDHGVWGGLTEDERRNRRRRQNRLRRAS